MNPTSVQDTPDILALLQETALFLWKDWPRDMEAVALDTTNKFSLRGECPHPSCKRNSTFVIVGGVYQHSPRMVQGNQQEVELVVAMQCQGCLKFILGLVTHRLNSMQYRYVGHYPLGEPDDTVAAEIPDHIQVDFQEALRCLWVDAYNATAEMCRRAIEASCLDLGAPKKGVLEDMIDWLEANRKITPDLKNAAHKVRLGGNRAAHPPVDGPPPIESATTAAAVEKAGPIEKIAKEHAEAIVEFTRHFLQCVYVIPKQLDKYDFSRPKAAKP